MDTNRLTQIMLALLTIVFGYWATVVERGTSGVVAEIKAVRVEIRQELREVRAEYSRHINDRKPHPDAEARLRVLERQIEEIRDRN